MRLRGLGFHLRRLRKEYNELKAENKALKENLSQQIRVNSLLAGRCFKVEQSRDELLNALKTQKAVLAEEDIVSRDVDRLIQKAEALKEKESK